MALSGSVTTSASHSRSLTLSWTATQDTASNKSTISWTLKGSGSASGWVKIHEVRVTVDGTVTYIKNADIQCYNGTVVTRGSKVVSHDAVNGTRTFKVEVEAGIYNSSINCSSSETTFTLNPIILGSTITSAGNVTLGNNCSIQWTPTSASYYYKLKFALGDWSHTISGIHPNQTTAYTYSGYQLPLANIAPLITNAKTATMTAYLYTYSDSAMTKQRGVASTKTFTVTVPSTTAPQLSNLSVSIDNSSNAVINSWNVAVAGYTKLAISAAATTSYGATISNYVLSGAYSTTVNTLLPYTGGAVSTSGNKAVSIYATDSRGYTSQTLTSSSVYFYPYNAPEISSFTVTRTSSEYSGSTTAVVVKGTWSYSSVGNNNVVNPKLYYKLTSSVSWIEYTGITLASGTELKLYAPLNGDYSVGFSELSAYDFRLDITDSLSSKAQSMAFIPTNAVLLDFRAGGEGLGIGRVAESDNLEIEMNTYFFGNVYFTNGTNVVSLAQYIQNIMNGVDGLTGT